MQCRRPQFDSWVGKIPWRRIGLSTLVFLGFPCDSTGKESACNVGDLGSIPELGRSPGEGKGYPLQYSGLENSMNPMGSKRIRHDWETFTSLKNFPQFVVIHTVKGFSIVNEAEVDIFLEFSCFSYDSTNIGSLISGPSAFSKSSLNIWKFSVHVLLKPVLKDFEHYFASVWDECCCAVVWTFFGIAFLWDWNKNWHFLVL